MFAAMHDVAGEFAEAEGELAGEVEKSAEDYEDDAEQEKSAAEVTKRIHKSIIEEAGGAREQPSKFLALFTNRL